jgi:hypothetical protein
MVSYRAIVLSILGILLSSGLLAAQDLSTYRGFTFGTTLEEVARQAGVKLSDAMIIHERPELIQELVWTAPTQSNPGERDSVGTIRFSFHNSKLFRMTVMYSFTQVDGLTPDDVIEALSVQYGTSSKPETTVKVSGSAGYDSGAEKVLARWEDSAHSHNLFRPSYQSTFGLVLLSKQLDLAADAAIREAQRLDKLEAPQKEITRQQERDDMYQAAQEKARLANKPRFRP